MPFKDTEKLGLEIGAHLADLVEHQRALIGRLELADLAFRRPGERPLLMPEQLAGEEVFREGGAIQADEDVLLARAGVVDSPGDELLADAALAADQQGRDWRRPGRSPR